MSYIPLSYLSFVLLTIFLKANAQSRNFSCEFGQSMRSPLCNYQILSTDNGVIFDTPNKTSEDLRVLSGPATGFNGRHNYLSFREGLTRLKSSAGIALSGFYCLSLDYYLLGPKAHLDIYAERDNRQPQDSNTRRRVQFRMHDYSLFSRNEISSFFDRWQHYSTSLNFAEGNYEVFINAYTLLSGTLALDNLRLEEGKCQSQVDSVKNCNLDNVIGSADEDDWNCDWIAPVRNLANDDFWELESRDDRYELDEYRLTRQTRFVYTDHSTQYAFGGYLRGATSGNKSLEIALRELTPLDGEQCFSFWMNLVIPGTKWQVTETATNTNVTNVLLENDEYDGHEAWHMKSVVIDPVVPLVVKIIVIGNSWIRFDDFKLTKGKCPQPLTCNFQNDICGYARWRHERMDWYIGKGRLMVPQPSQIGVDYDRDYLYVDMTNTNDDLLRMNSETFSGHGEYCYRISFTAEPDTRTRQVGMVTGVEGFSVTPLRSQFRNEEGQWILGLADINILGKQDKMFRIQIAFRGGRRSTISRVRDVALVEGTCAQYLNPPAPVILTFGEVQFHCHQTGHYIPKYRSCDGVIDCPMGEDEGEQCEEHNCAEGGIPCRRRGHAFCLANIDQFCDRIADCDDAIDEDPRMCNLEPFCDNYCLNGGVCSFENFTCDCVDDYRGKRCSFK